MLNRRVELGLRRQVGLFLGVVDVVGQLVGPWRRVVGIDPCDLGFGMPGLVVAEVSDG